MCWPVKTAIIPRIIRFQKPNQTINPEDYVERNQEIAQRGEAAALTGSNLTII